MGIFTFCLRTFTLSWQYGIVESRIPIIPISLDETSINRKIIPNQYQINKNTPTIVITTDALYFGDLESFTTKFDNIHNKFIVQHDDGRPQLTKLIEDMNGWNSQRISKNINEDNVLVLLPANEVPLSIVIQVMHWMKTSTLYKEVVLASELI